MKRTLLFMVLLVTQVIPSYDTTAQNINIDIPENTDVMRCRCKEGGCYGGNMISIYSLCAVSHGTINCSEYVDNCAPNNEGVSDIVDP